VTTVGNVAEQFPPDGLSARMVLTIKPCPMLAMLPAIPAPFPVKVLLVTVSSALLPVIPLEMAPPLTIALLSMNVLLVTVSGPKALETAPPMPA
jgi:hypothetical protein